jgi:hypothetical protein
MKLRDLNQPAVWLLKAVILIGLIASLFSCKAYKDSLLEVREIRKDTVICTNLAGEETFAINPYHYNLRIGMTLKEVNRFSPKYIYDDIVSCDSINFE